MFPLCFIRGYLPVLGLVFGVASLAVACNVPVFRFALERWRADPYRVTLVHRGPLTDSERELLRPLEEQEAQGATNLAIRAVDVIQLDASDELAASDSSILDADKSAELPLLVLQFPERLSIAKPIWTGPPSREALARIADSPVRQELIRRLAAGQTAVWLVLESGQREADEASAALVESEIKTLEQELELPELTDAPEDAIAASAPLAVEFSALRVRCDDPAEQALVAMLIGSEADLAGRTDPMVFPVYGRGRALWGLIGAGITAKNIHDSAAFLVGPCSCEVKELNPGFDLLLAADWDELLAGTGLPLSAAETTKTAPTAQAVLLPIPAGSSPGTVTHYPAPVVVRRSLLPPIGSQPLGASVLFGGGILVALLVIGIAIAAAIGAGRGSKTDH